MFSIKSRQKKHMECNVFICPMYLKNILLRKYWRYEKYGSFCNSGKNVMFYNVLRLFMSFLQKKIISNHVLCKFLCSSFKKKTCLYEFFGNKSNRNRIVYLTFDHFGYYLTIECLFNLFLLRRNNPNNRKF